MSWERDQEEYRLSKRDSEETPAIIIVCIVIAALVALCVEGFTRVFG